MVGKELTKKDLQKRKKEIKQEQDLLLKEMEWLQKKIKEKKS